MSEESQYALGDAGVYPDFEKLKELIRNKRVKFYDAVTSCGAIESLFKKARARAFDLTGSESDISKTRPDILTPVADEALKKALCASCLILVTLHQRDKKDDKHLLFLRCAPEPEVVVTAKMPAAKTDGDCVEESFKFPACHDFNGLIKCFDASYILANCEDKEGVREAIQVAWHQSQLERGKNPDWEWDASPPNLRIHKDFLGTVRKHCKQGKIQEKLLRTIVELLHGENMDTEHPIRVSKGGDGKKRKRDGATAWRRDIDDEYHLHYWRCPHNIVELAVVAYPHDSFSIPE